MISIICLILLQFLQSERLKLLIVDLLQQLAAKTDNDLDDTIVQSIRKALFPRRL